MKIRVRHIAILLITIFVIFSSKVVLAAEIGEEYKKQYTESIYKMAKLMRCIPKTGDVNLDYLYEAALFSNGEVEFSKVYIKYSDNEEVKKIAEGYVERESAAIENIKSVIENLKDNVKENQEKEEGYLSVYNNILNDMICRLQKVELTDDINIDYLKFISIHHEGFISLTEEFLKVSDNEEIREMADKLNDEMKNDMSVIDKYI